MQRSGRRGEERRRSYAMVTFDGTTPIDVYCKRAALHHARPIDPQALPPVFHSLRRGYPYLCTIHVEQNVSTIAHPVWLPLCNMPGPTPFVCEGGLQATGLPVSLYYSRGAKRFQDIAPGLVASACTTCLAPPLLCARGVYRQRGNRPSDMPR